MVGLEHTLFKISNDVGMVELCAVVYQPANVECPIEFSFNVRLATMDGTAGKIYTCTCTCRCNSCIVYPSLITTVALMWDFRLI